MTVEIPGVLHRSLDRHPDERGFFSEIFRSSETPDALAQANHSHSKSGVVRGLHYHREQADLWYVAGGRIRVGLADLRVSGGIPTTSVVEMSADRPSTLYIPSGVAHGFAALTDCDLIYWVTAEFDAADEFGVAWDDPDIAIEWGIEDPILSPRDRANPRLDWEAIQSSS